MVASGAELGVSQTLGKSQTSEGVLVHPLPFSEQSVLDSAKNLIIQAVNPQDHKPDTEEITWVRFANCDLNDVVRNPLFKGEQPLSAGLVVLIGYSHGLAVWYLMAGQEARELYSTRTNHKCRTALVLPTPITDKPQVISRPWLATVNGPEVKIVSLATSKMVKSISADGEIEEIEANEKVLAISSTSTISLYCAETLKIIYTIKDSLVPGRDCNPFSLGSRWIAYSPEKLDMGQQSLGGYCPSGTRSYTATMLSAAKTLGKGISILGETVGRMAGNNHRNFRGARDDEQKIKGYRGIVSIVDIQLLLDNQDEPIKNSIVAHWVAHPQPVASCAFNPSGNVLITADISGREFHVFSIHVHPVSSCDSAVHHLYTLQRGDTTAQVHNFTFSQDSRWVSAVTRRGTAHIFPINPYGGSPSVRTHCVNRVSNQRSLFHISAGLDKVESGQKEKSTSQIASSNQSTSPRLPPFPHPTFGQPVVQIKQGLVLGLLPSGAMADQSDDSSGEQLSSIFAFSKTCVAFARDIFPHRSRDWRPEGLYVISNAGVLSEYALETSGVKQHNRVTDDSPIDVMAQPLRQWPLQRQRSWVEIRAPLSMESPLLLAASCLGSGSAEILKAKLESKRQRTSSMSSRRAQDEQRRMRNNNSPRSRHSSSESEPETKAGTEWLAQIEMDTHDGPARRLWMGPQFKFQAKNNQRSPFEPVNSGLMRPTAILDSQEEIETRRVERSAPMPIMRRAQLSDQFSVPGSSMPTIEVGSGTFDRVGQLVDYGHFPGEDRVRESLEDAIEDTNPPSTARRLSDKQCYLSESDGEVDYILNAVGEFELNSSPPSSVNSLQLQP